MQRQRERQQRVFALAMPAVSEQILNTMVGLMDVLSVQANYP
jgi:Na+-driven multidrug efflux pump